MGSQPDLLAGLREVVAGRTVGEPRCLVGDEQRLGRTADQPVAFGEIVEQPRDDARIERQQPLLAELALPDAQHAMIGVEVVTIERERLADPEPVTAMSPNRVEQVSPRKP